MCRGEKGEERKREKEIRARARVKVWACNLKSESKPVKKESIKRR